MGLDQYLTAKTYIWSQDRATDIETGLKIRGLILDIHYWRKHPNLHGFIVENFAEKDDCEPIRLNTEMIDRIIDAIEKNKLPETTGFFFGESRKTQEQKAEDLQAFKKAKEVSKTHDVYYQASW